MTSLASIPALRGLNPATLDAIIRDSRAVSFSTRALLRPAGEPARAVILLLSGTVAAVYTGPSGAQVWPARWQSPAIVDKPSVLDGGAPSSALLAITRCAVRIMPRARFLRLLDEEESVRTHVLSHLAKETLDSRRRLAQAATLPAVSQVACWLTAHDPAHTCVWRGSQEDLARLLGLSRVTVNRALARLAQAGALQVTTRGIVVVDRQRLESFALGT